MSEALPFIKQRGWPLLATLITFVAVVIMVLLGLWQLDRADQKQQRLKQIVTRSQASTITLSSLLNMQNDRRDILFSAEGTLDNARYFLIDNRIHKGQVGYQVVAPLMTDAGLLLINFGWVSAGLYRGTLPEVTLPGQQRQFSGISAQPSDNPMITETAQPDSQWPVVLQQLDLAIAEQFLGDSVLPVVMQLEDESAGDFVQDWTPVVMPPEKHVAYAIQWFGLAIACMLVFLFAVKKRKAKL